MADRTVSVRLQANVASFMASMRAASTSTEDFARRNRAEMEQVGQGLLGVGVAAIGGLGLATKAAIDWESAWAGVTKTVDGSAQQMATLEGELRDMAKELPASHEEIAAVAEAAGQLGVQQSAIAGFTRTMIDLGETTNLSATEAATSLARFSNIMGTSQDDVSRLGSTIVDLGNNTETTEAEILTLGTRLAAAGKIAGLSESDVLAFSATLTSVGVEAEAGGTALSKTFITMRDAVLDGGDALDTFAEVAGTTAEDFAASFQRDPADAIAQFIAGLGEMNEAGQSTTGVFEELELTDQRLMRALLSTASAEDLLVDSLERGDKAWEENTALTEEAQRRYETAAAQIQMAWNSIRDAAIEVGSVVAPIVADLAGFIGDLADAFGDLPDGVDVAVAAVLGIGGALSFAGGAALLLAPRIVETKNAMQALNLTTGKTGSAIRGLGRAARAAGVIGALFLVSEAILAIRDASRDAPPEIGETTQALLDLSDGIESEVIAGLQDMHAEIVEQREKLQEAKNSWTEYKDSFAGTDLDDIVAGNEEFAAAIGSVDDALAQMVAGGNIKEADDAVHAFAEAFGISRGEMDQLLSVLPGYQDALASADAEQRLAADSADELGGELGEEKTAAEKATEALQAYQDELRAMTDPVFAVFDALDQVEQAQDDYNAAVEEHGEKSDEAQAASIRHMQALENLEQAALNGDLSFKDFSARLDTWVERGDLTAAQAAEIRDRVKEARGEAEDFTGDYEARMKAETRNASREIRGLLRRGREWDESHFTATATVNIGATGLDVGRFFGSSFLDRHQGGPVMHDGGPVTRMHSGGLRPDERDVRLKVGEFVVQAPAVQRLGLPAMRAINQGQMPGGGGVTVQGPLIGEVKTLSGDRFSLPELENDLRFSGAA